jgi:REP element-mobilizing transposase RayT
MGYFSSVPRRLKLLRENIELYRVSLIGYCLMSNHIHLIAIPGISSDDNVEQSPGVE